MLNAFFADTLHRTGFANRAVPAPDGFVVYRLRDGSGSVRLPRTEWEEIGNHYAVEVATLSKRTRRFNLFLFPAILVFGMTAAQLLPFGGLLILLGIFGGPLTIYLWHSRMSERCADRAEAHLATFPRTASVDMPIERPPRALQIAALIVGGPYLLIAVIGEIGGPDTFRNTPLSGAHVGWFEVVAFAILGIHFAWPTLVSQLVRRRHSD